MKIYTMCKLHVQQNLIHSIKIYTNFIGLVIDEDDDDVEIDETVSKHSSNSHTDTGLTETPI